MTALIGIGIAALGSMGSSTSDVDDVATTTASSEAPPTTTTSTTTSPTPSTVPPTTTTAAPSGPRTVPGLDPLDVTLNMKQLGYRCGNAEKGELYWTYSCDRDLDNVTVYTDAGRKVLQVEASVIGDGAQSMLEYVATVPYQFATPRAAQRWVRDNFPHIQQGKPVETTFGGVPYTLYGNPSGGAYFLEIGHLDG